MVTVERWTGREVRALRDALKMSVRDFAAHTNLATSTITDIEAKGEHANLRRGTQRVLDEALATAPQPAQQRFHAARCSTGADDRGGYPGEADVGRTSLGTTDLDSVERRRSTSLTRQPDRPIAPFLRVPGPRSSDSVPVLEWPVLYGASLARLIATIDNWLGTSAPADALQDLLHQELAVFDATAPEDRDPVRVVSRRQALVALAALPATFAASTRVATSPPAAATGRFVSRCAASLTACWHLLKGCDLNIIDQMISSYLLELDGIARQPSAHQQTAARLASQAHRICGIIALHRNQLAARERHCKQAFHYAEAASDVISETAALVSLASTYFYRGDPARAASVYEQALSYGQPGLTPLQYSRVHAELAAVYGQLGRERDALRSVSVAEQSYPSDPEQDQSFLYAEFTRGSLALEQGLAYAALAETYPDRRYQRRAADVLAVVEQAPFGAVPDRIRFEIANHQARTAVLLNDFDAFETYMYRGSDGVMQLESRQRHRELHAAWRSAAEAWPGERRLDALGQRLTSRLIGPS